MRDEGALSREQVVWWEEERKTNTSWWEPVPIHNTSLSAPYWVKQLDSHMNMEIQVYHILATGLTKNQGLSNE